MVTLFRNADIWTPEDTGTPACGPGQARLSRWERGCLLSRDGRIQAVGDEQAVTRGLRPREVEQEVDCGGRCMVPGFVDAHTHLCFLSPREKEFQARLSGADYLQILNAGGGILSSVQSVRSASEEELFARTRARALSALRMGTTTMEIKSGYGLALEPELKQLRVIARVSRETPLTVVPTFLGAHAVPPEYTGRAEAYVETIVTEMIPAVSRAGAARFCDVFCEEGVFSTGQSRRILEAARAAGMGIRLHADEMHDTGGAELAASLHASCADHLLAARDSGIAAMARAGVIGVLLPATAYTMRRPFAAPRTMIDKGLAVAIATDCNPGSSFTESMPFVFGLAVLQMGLSVPEALTAATLNAAYSLGLGREAGSLTQGKKADLLLLEGETPAILAFHAGVSPVAEVFAAGRSVAAKEMM